MSPEYGSLHAVKTMLFHACLNIHYVPGLTDFVRMGLIVVCVRQMVLGLVHPGQINSAAAGLVGPGLVGVLARPTAARLVGPGLVGVLPRLVAGLVNPRLVGVLSVNNTWVAQDKLCTQLVQFSIQNAE
jgi:hypothetical protein